MFVTTFLRCRTRKAVFVEDSEDGKQPGQALDLVDDDEVAASRQGRHRLFEESERKRVLEIEVVGRARRQKGSGQSCFPDLARTS